MAVSPDVDAQADHAWRAFRGRLADHVAGLEDGEVLVVETDPADDEGTEPYVQFLGLGDGLLRAEVSSNVWLRAERRLDAAAEARLVELGWAAPLSDEVGLDENFYLDAGTREADRVAELAVVALREVFGVPHPVFLTADGLEREPGQPVPDDGPPAGDELPLAVQPRDRDELVDWVDRVLTPVFGHPPRHDEDDDIPVNAGTAALFVRVRDDMPAVQIFCRLVGGVRDPEAAVHEVNLLNAEHRFVDFALVDDAVMADVHVLAMPLAPAHLRDMLEVMCGVADRVGPVLARRVGGEVAFTARTTADEEDPLEDLLVEHDDDGPDWNASLPPIESLPAPPAMEVLRHLEIDRPGSVTAEVAATVCDWDRDTLLELLDWNDAEECRWRHEVEVARRQDDEDEADVCEMLRSEAAEALRLLRRALRLQVDRQLRHGGPTERRDRRRDLRQPRRARGRDVSLPGLDRLADDDPALFDDRPSWREVGRPD